MARRRRWDDGEIEPERITKLWRAVIVEVMRGALRTSPMKDCNWPEIAECRRWFGSPEYATVCALASVERGEALAAQMRAEVAQLVDKRRAAA